jgi:hypothetical protein
LFNKLLERVTFEDLTAFCERFPEGVRAEYKRAPAHIDKVIASLANTAGGFLVLGVRTDDKNMPMLPIEGMPARKGLEEQIVQIAQTAIYPALTPAVRILDVPTKPGNVVVIVKVAESIEAPHAVDDATKVYVRVASTTPPYQLADVDRIEYLLRRRHEPERRREEIIQQMAARSFYAGHSMKIRVAVAPVYPRGVLLPMDTLIERAEHLKAQSVRPLRDYRLVHNGIRSARANPGQRQWHFEADTHGVIFFEEPATARGQVQDWRTKEQVPFVNLFDFTSPIGHVLNIAAALLAGAATNVMIRCEVFGFTGVGFIYGGGAVANEHRCDDPHISVSTVAVLETLANRRVAVIIELLRDVLYAFNWPRPDDLPAVVTVVLKDQHII